MSFVINGNEWTFNEVEPDIHKSIIDSFLDRVGIAINRDEKIWIGDDLQKRIVYEEKDFWTFMSEMPTEIVQELSAWLDRAPLYLNEDNFPDELIYSSLITINGQPEEDNIDLSWAHYNNINGIAVGCIGLHNSGIVNTSSTLGEAELHVIKNEHEHLNFWRNAIELEGNNTDKFRALSQNAFPNLYFHEDVLNGLDNLAGGYSPLRKSIMKYMSIFNDYGEWIFTTPPPALSPNERVEKSGAEPSNQVIRNRFTGFGLTVEPENPNVYSNNGSRMARTITIKDINLYCEWHGKLQAHQNRIHIHKPIPESENKIVIAFICEHLPLP
ncbi:hypothetical protein ACEUBW_17265 [Aeromonas veronii]|uniref:hypothetical protein n=1 Tax=Aeromonas veronii TaxID=654 RepID=UPI0038F46E1D